MAGVGLGGAFGARASATSSPTRSTPSTVATTSTTRFGTSLKTTLVGGAGLHPRLGPGSDRNRLLGQGGFGSAAASPPPLPVPCTTAAFQLTGMEEVHIHCDEANVASAGVPRGLGFRLLRTIEDEVDAPAEVGRSMEWVIAESE